MHFFNPVHKMKLVELICGLATDVATLEASRQWIDAIGKASITVNESPGFTTSRMSALMGNEAMYMLAEGVATAERSEEHTSELQSLMRISSAVFCLKKKNHTERTAGGE